MTSNAPDTAYLNLLTNYKKTFDRFVGPTTIFIYGDTLQLKDYSKIDWPWTMFNPEHKYNKHQYIYPAKLKEIHTLSKNIFK